MITVVDVLFAFLVSLSKAALLGLFIIFTALHWELRESRRLYKFFTLCFVLLIIAMG